MFFKSVSYPCHHRGCRARYGGTIAPPVLLMVSLFLCASFAHAQEPVKKHLASPPNAEFAGSTSCRECHEGFYKLWEPSFHGKAMQPFTAELANAKLTAPDKTIMVGDYTFTVDLANLQVIEQSAAGRDSYPIVHALGGKNVFYFLTPMDRGRLQVLPIAYDMQRKEWYDTTGSMVRHFADDRDEALDWHDPLLTFNTACFNCHVSQLSTNYDLKTDTYNTVWREPGINCETCHGPASEHNRVCRAAAAGTVPDDIKIIKTSDMTPRQRDETCVPCHAKMRTITNTFIPGARFFDHYGLTTFEDRDFYPDGRDLGENYTYTLWLTSPCVKSGQLECLHCHTSSGRYRFHGENENGACLPCHKEQAADIAKHSHHKPGSGKPVCISCHMPMTEFGRMRRSDHSMRPPTPATSVAFGSPSACTICHITKDAAWADKQVRTWHKEDYQAPHLEAGHLVQTARKQDWTKLPAMLDYLKRASHDAVVATSLIRLLEPCPDERKIEVLVQLLDDPSPLVRSAASIALTGVFTPEVRTALAKRAADDYRLVRVSAAGALSRCPPGLLTSEERDRLARATRELETSLTCRSDDWSSHYNMGNLLSERGKIKEALESYAISSHLRPDVVQPRVNASMLYARLGKVDEAEKSLRAALDSSPNSAPALFNLGLLLGENGQNAEAERCLRSAFEADRTMADAAYNLGVLIMVQRPEEGIDWCRKAAALDPDSGKYGYTLAFYLHHTGQTDEAVEILTRLVRAGTDHVDAYMLLASVHQEAGKMESVRSVLEKAIANPGLPERERARFAAWLRAVDRER